MSDYNDIVKFTTHLRSIEGLRLFNIFTKYGSFIDIDKLFNFLARFESEATLRELETMWEEFIQEKEEGSEH
jgi:hypothetical protein